MRTYSFRLFWLLAFFCFTGFAAPDDPKTEFEFQLSHRRDDDPIALLKAGKEVGFHMLDENDETPTLQFLKGTGEATAIYRAQKTTRDTDIPRLYRKPPFNYTDAQIEKMRAEFTIREDYAPMVFRGVVLQPMKSRTHARVLLCFLFREVPLGTVAIEELATESDITLEIPSKPVNFYIITANPHGKVKFAYNVAKRELEIDSARGGVKLWDIGYGTRRYKAEKKALRGILASYNKPLERKPIDENAGK